MYVWPACSTPGRQTAGTQQAHFFEGEGLRGARQMLDEGLVRSLTDEAQLLLRLHEHLPRDGHAFR